MLKQEARTLCQGEATGELLVLQENISFWGGFNLETGAISDQKHPQCGTVLSQKILVLRSGRGSSSASSVLAESIRSGLGPAAILLLEPDPIIALGALVAAELYKKECPVVVLGLSDWQSLKDGVNVRVRAGQDFAKLELLKTNAF